MIIVASTSCHLEIKQNKNKSKKPRWEKRTGQTNWLFWLLIRNSRQSAVREGSGRKWSAAAALFFPHYAWAMVAERLRRYFKPIVLSLWNMEKQHNPERERKKERMLCTSVVYIKHSQLPYPPQSTTSVHSYRPETFQFQFGRVPFCF